jgi:hypothetical protein
MAKVDIQAGPHRIVSLMSREAADELGLEPGVLAVASVKATNVVIEVPAQPAAQPAQPGAQSAAQSGDPDPAVPPHQGPKAKEH